MALTNPKKTVTPAAINCQGTAEVTLSFRAAAELANHPADIVLIMDRSCSMNLQRMFQARKGANQLIATVAEATTGDRGADIGMGSRIGIVSFASEATQNVQLTTRQDLMTTAIASLQASRSTASV